MFHGAFSPIFTQKLTFRRRSERERTREPSSEAISIKIADHTREQIFLQKGSKYCVSGEKYGNTSFKVFCYNDGSNSAVKN